MHTVVLLAATLTAVAAAGVLAQLLVEKGSLRRGLVRRRSPAGDRLAASDELPLPEVLSDPRSCLQAALVCLRAALHKQSAEDQKKAPLQLIGLLQASPQVVFSEVVDDRILATFEKDTKAEFVWIISSDESIEFAYPEPGVSFSSVVLDNLGRGIIYRYLVMDTPATRKRAELLVQKVRAKGLDEHLQIRFLPESYWAAVKHNTDEILVFDGSPAVDMFYLFPGTGQPGTLRRWIRAPRRDAEAQSRDVRATWDLTSVSLASSQDEHGVHLCEGEGLA